MELTPTVVEDCVKVCEDQEKDALVIPEISVGEGFWARCRSLDKQIYIGERGFEAARFVKKEAFDAVGGYDQDLEAGEDYDLHYRIELAGYKISCITSLIRHHEGQLTSKKILRKCRYYGRSMNKYAKKNKLIRKPIYVQLWIKKWKLLVKNPQCFVGLILIKLVEFVFVGRHSRFVVLK